MTARRVRASAIVVREGHLLAVRHFEETYWSPPGGGIDPGELSVETALRELAEEVGCEGRAMGLVYILENHFTYAGRRVEEVGFGHLVEVAEAALPGPSERTEFAGTEFGGREAHITAGWLALDALAARDLRPVPLQTALAGLARRELSGGVPAGGVHHLSNVE